MNALSILALIMLVLVGYSSGMALVRGNLAIQPMLFDLALVVVLWVGALVMRPTFGRGLSILIWFLVAFVSSCLITFVRRAEADEALPKSELPEHAREQPEGDTTQGFWRRVWAGWTAFAEEMGNVQGRLLMGFFYFIVVTPFGLGTRIFSDPLRIKEAPAGTAWLPKEEIDQTIEEAREQG